MSTQDNGRHPPLAWSPGARQVIVTAETLAAYANDHRPWWRRKRVSPMEYVDVAKVVVEALAAEVNRAD